MLEVKLCCNSRNCPVMAYDEEQKVATITDDYGSSVVLTEDALKALHTQLTNLNCTEQ